MNIYKLHHFTLNYIWEMLTYVTLSHAVGICTYKRFKNIRRLLMFRFGEGRKRVEAGSMRSFFREMENINSRGVVLLDGCISARSLARASRTYTRHNNI